jgi:hypothetical protein
MTIIIIISSVCETDIVFAPLVSFCVRCEHSCFGSGHRGCGHSWFGSGHRGPFACYLRTVMTCQGENGPTDPRLVLQSLCVARKYVRTRHVLVGANFKKKIQSLNRGEYYPSIDAHHIFTLSPPYSCRNRRAPATIY